ncbi:ABC transporter permease [Streptomyces sp. PT12]|uniref:ABC transporter permease n=1 Tax=Streptomyces sp. PT12 TaxID=1510197 RepID=UPI000DE446FB|nr:ABC transporter permease [Streptomyces sp. PT12]RBM19751.1 ABC transporter permease [Streptomyces sp. PT12]
MTDPQPAPDHHPESPSTGGPPGGGSPGQRTDWRREIADGVRVALPLAAASGLALGLLWLWLAPRVPLVSDGRSVMLANSEGQQAIAADGTFLLLGLAIGAVAGVVVFALRRTGGVALVLGLAAGALAGSWLAWQLGMWLGPTDDVAAAARDAGVDNVFDASLRLGAKGVLFALPAAAVGAHLLCQAVLGPRDPEPVPVELPQWRE